MAQPLPNPRFALGGSLLCRLLPALLVIAVTAPAQHYVHDEAYQPQFRQRAPLRIYPQPNGIIAASGARFLGEDVAPGYFRISPDGEVLGALEPPLSTESDRMTSIVLPDGRRVIAQLSSDGWEMPSYRDVTTYDPAGNAVKTLRFNTTAPGVGIGGAVPPLLRSFKLVALPDGRVCAGGDFSEVDGQPRSSLARIQFDGTLDPAYAPRPADGLFRDLVALPDGSVVIATGGIAISAPRVGGRFASGPARLSRILADGSTDPGYEATVEDPALFLVQADGRIVVRGTPLQRLLPGGAVDPAFATTVPGLGHVLGIRPINDAAMLVDGTDEDGLPCVLALGTDGQILLNFADLFPENSAVGLEGLDNQGHAWVRWGRDGALEEVWGFGREILIEGPSIARVALAALPGGGAPTATHITVTPAATIEGRVNRLHLDGAGRIIVTGDFDSFDGQPRSRVARLLADGTLDPAFAPTDLGPTATACHVSPDGRVLVRQTAGSARAYQRLLADGTPDGTLAADSALARDFGAEVVGVDAQGNFLAIVNPASDDAVTAPVVRRYAPDGALLQTITDLGGMRRLAHVVALPDGRLLVSAAFLDDSGSLLSPERAMVRLATDGTLDPTYTLDLGRNATILNLALVSDGTALAIVLRADEFPETSETVRIRTDGSVDPVFRASPGQANALLLHATRPTPFGGYITTVPGPMPLLFTAEGAVSAVPGAIGYPIHAMSDHIITPDGSSYYQCGGFSTAFGAQMFTLWRSRLQPEATFARQPYDGAWVAGEDGFVEVVFNDPAHATYQWQRDGVDIPGAQSSRLFLDDLSTAQAGTYRCIITVGTATFVSEGAPVLVFPNTAKVINFSARSRVEPGHTQIGGLVVDDPLSQPALLRAIGSALPWDLGVPLLPDPVLTIHERGSPFAENRGGTGAPAIVDLGERLGAFRPRTTPPGGGPALPPNAALALTLAPGVYTAHTTAYDGAPGVSLFEYYDADPDGAGTGVRNISIRATTGPGADVLIPGFIVRGSGGIRLLIRAIGPSLADFGVPDAVDDPRIIVQSPGGGIRFGSNDDWGGDPLIAAAADAVDAFALDPASKDAALIFTARAGAYTLPVLAAADQRGEVLVEIYVLDP